MSLRALSSYPEKVPPPISAPKNRTVSGVLTLKWWPLYNPGSGNILKGFAFTTLKEPGDRYPSSHTSGLVMATIDSSAFAWLKPGSGAVFEERGTGTKYFIGNQKPMFSVFPTYTPWIQAPCLKKFLLRIATVDPPYKRLVPGIMEGSPKEEWDHFFEYASTSADRCPDEKLGRHITVAWAEGVLETSYKRNIEIVKFLFKKKMEENDPSRFDSDYARATAIRNQQHIQVALARLLVARHMAKRDVPEEWKPILARGLQIFAVGPSPGRGPRALPKQALPGMPTLIRSNIPGEEELVVREVPWSRPFRDDE